MSNYSPDEPTARVDLLRFLSACYYEPAAEFAEEGLFDSILLATRQAYPELAGLAARVGQAFAQETLQTLLVDYTRLFLGPMKALASPYASSWLPAPLVGEEVLPPLVLDWYEEADFEVDAELAELPDHVAIELEFLYLLTFRIRQAALTGNMADLKSNADLRERFLNEHLVTWISPFVAALKAHAETAFYRELAELSKRVIGLESARHSDKPNGP